MILFEGLTGRRLAAVDGVFSKIPNQYVLNNDPFSDKSKPLKIVAFTVKDGHLYVINADQASAPSGYTNASKGKTYSLEMNSYLAKDVLRVEDVAELGIIDNINVREASENEALFERQETLAMSHAITEAWGKYQALQGRVVTAEGRVLLDMADEFGVARKKIDLKLTSSDTDIRVGLDSIDEHFDENLMGQTMSKIVVLCTPKYMSNLKSNASLNDAFKQSGLSRDALYQSTLSGKPFIVPGYEHIEFYVDRAKAPVLKADGTTETRRFIAETSGVKGQAIAYPMGTRDVFRMYRGPAMRFDNLGKAPVGNGRYIKTKKSDDDKRIDIDTESVWLPVVVNPALTITLNG